MIEMFSGFLKIFLSLEKIIATDVTMIKPKNSVSA